MGHVFLLVLGRPAFAFNFFVVCVFYEYMYLWPCACALLVSVFTALLQLCSVPHHQILSYIPGSVNVAVVLCTESIEQPVRTCCV